MRRMLAMAALLGMTGAAVAQETDARKAEALTKLNTQRITLDFQDAPFDDVISFIRECAGLNIHVDGDIRARLSDEQLKVSFKAKDLLLKSALKLILSGRDLRAVYRDGVLVIEHKEKAGTAVSLRVYDVRDLLLKIPDFPGPRMELAQDRQVGVIVEFCQEEPPARIDENLILDLVKSSTGERSWEENPKAGISLANGLLIVTQSKRVHEEIRRLLDALRALK